MKVLKTFLTDYNTKTWNSILLWYLLKD